MERSAFDEDLEEVFCKINAALIRNKTQNCNGIDSKSSSNGVKVKLPNCRCHILMEIRRNGQRSGKALNPHFIAIQTYLA